MKLASKIVVSVLIFLIPASGVQDSSAAAGFDIYRDDAQGGPYTLRHRGLLTGLRTYPPLIQTQFFSGGT